MPRVHAAQPHGRAPVQRVRLLEVWRLRPAQQLAATRVPRMSSVTRWLQGDARQGGGEAKAQAAACRCCRQPVGRIPAAAIPPPPRVERHHEAQRSARGAEDHPEPAAAAPTTSSACVLCASAPPHRPVDPARSGAAHGLAPCHVQYQLKIIEYALLSMVCVHRSAFESCGTISKEKPRGESRDPESWS